MYWLKNFVNWIFKRKVITINDYIETPKEDLPIDEAFVKNFKAKGGIFIYVDKIRDLPDVFQTIVSP